MGSCMSFVSFQHRTMEEGTKWESVALFLQKAGEYDKARQWGLENHQEMLQIFIWSLPSEGTLSFIHLFTHIIPPATIPPMLILLLETSNYFHICPALPHSLQDYIKNIPCFHGYLCSAIRNSRFAFETAQLWGLPSESKSSLFIACIFLSTVVRRIAHSN